MIRLLGVFVAFLTTSLHAAAPYLVRDLETRSTPRGSLSSLSWLWPSAGPSVYFVADDGANTPDLWTTDGTTTRAVTNDGLMGGADYLGQVGRTVIYNSRSTIWASDGGAPVALITNGNDTAYPRIVFKDRVYFETFRNDSGWEIWKTDGTVAGTTLLDFNPGPASSNSHSFVIVGDVMYFFGTTPAGTGLHRTDGTVGGTSMVTNINSEDPGMVSLGNGKFVFFTIDAPSETSTLWVSDGTAAGTTLLRAGFTENEDSIALPLALLGNRMIFSADEPTFGEEMWVTDGTVAGTRVLHDITPGPFPSYPLRGARVGDRYFFAAEDDNDFNLYTTDGTTSGLQKVISLGNTSVFAAGASVNGRFVFVRRTDTHGSEWWSSDGTAAGTQLLADIWAGPGSSYIGTTYARLPNALVFRANSDVHGHEPYITDGTPAGTRLLKDIAPNEQFGFNPVQLAWSGSRLFFAGQSGHIAVSDGTEAGTRAIVTGSSQARVVEGVTSGGLYFYVTLREISSAVQMTVWRSDGTDAGTFALHQQTSPQYDLKLTPFQGGVLFAGYDGSLDLGPWFSDGTVAGTRRVRDLDPAGAARNLPIIHATGTTALIGFGNTVWRTDGSEAGTVQVASLDQPAAVIQHFASLGSSVFFSTVSPTALWRTDGSSTTLVRTLDDGPIANLYAAGSTLFFSAGNKMWRSDGTAAGTFALGETDELRCSETSLVSIGNNVYWLTGRSLWRSDGTTAGTTRVATFDRTGCADALVAHGRRLYFAAMTTATGDELWTSDGTSGGTHLLADLHPGAPSSFPTELTLAGDRLFFVATTPEAGRELYAYDIPKSGKTRAVR